MVEVILYQDLCGTHFNILSEFAKGADTKQSTQGDAGRNSRM